jgi:hypothetical protein
MACLQELHIKMTINIAVNKAPRGCIVEDNLRGMQ